MAMRPILKKLKNEIDTKFGHEYEDKYFDLLEGCVYDKKKQASLTRYLRSHCVKLRPFTIPAGTCWIEKSSSGSCYGTIVKNCKAIGLIKESSYELLLDRPASLSNFCQKHGIGLQFGDDTVILSTLSTELLEQIDRAIIR